MNTIDYEINNLTRAVIHLEVAIDAFEGSLNDYKELEVAIDAFEGSLNDYQELKRVIGDLRQILSRKLLQRHICLYLL